MFDLSGKGALVTGATGGIGGAIAKALHDQGATVAISGTNAAKLEKLAGELGDRVFVLPCDLRDRTAVAGLAEDAEKAVGQVDILVNNAGITKDNLFMRMKDEEWDDVLSVNLTSVFALTRGIVRGMMRRRGGRIVNIASISGVLGNPGQGNYAASKAGLVGMTKSRGPRHNGQLHCTGLYLHAHDGSLDREANGGYCRRHPIAVLRPAGRCGGCSGVFRKRRSILHHWRNDACERRHDHGLRVVAVAFRADAIGNFCKREHGLGASGKVI